MPFGVATKVTNILKAMLIDRLQTTPATYTTPPKWIGMGTGATAAARTAAATDTALSTEVETRAVGVESIVTTSVAGDTYRVTGTQAATGTRAVDEFGTFDQLAAGGHMGVSGTQNIVSLLVGDSITWQIDTQQL